MYLEKLKRLIIWNGGSTKEHKKHYRIQLTENLLCPERWTFSDRQELQIHGYPDRTRWSENKTKNNELWTIVLFIDNCTFKTTSFASNSAFPWRIIFTDSDLSTSCFQYTLLGEIQLIPSFTILTFCNLHLPHLSTKVALKIHTHWIYVYSNHVYKVGCYLTP